MDAGLQLMPFGYEVGVRSSADLDLLERSAVSRAFLRASTTSASPSGASVGPLNLKVGLFNGNGVDGAGRQGQRPEQGRHRPRSASTSAPSPAASPAGTARPSTTRSTDNTEYDRARVGADLQVFLDLLPARRHGAQGRVHLGQDARSAPAAAARATRLGVIGWGWYGILTQNVGPWNQIAVRYEQFKPDRRSTRDARRPTEGEGLPPGRDLGRRSTPTSAEICKLSLA